MEPLLSRIEINPEVLVGKPVIKGTRLSVPFIVGLLAAGMSVEEVLAEYPRLHKDDIFACLLFATKALESNLFLPFEQRA
ncbi:MAG: DUF433 domain-containing protein [Saprospiraceae bacterium]|nr:DUF433 domain-containing protein [Saprospiraceae bacterium]